MKVKNTTPFLFGPRVTSRRPPQPEMTLVVRAGFELRPNQPLTPLEDQGTLTADTFRPDDEELIGDVLYPGDFSDFKLNAEVMLRGTCHPPAGKLVTESMVRFQVGTWSKLLRVVGPRAWSDRRAGAIASEPLPLKKTTLDYTQSFGGPTYPGNPVGKGFETDLLPCIESPTHPIRTRSDRPPPAGFGPINPAWPQRAHKVGKEYGQSYREKRAPFYAEDFDWTYFHAAPSDQQIKGYLRGDEEVVFEGLHPEATRLSTRLPGLRIRAWVKDIRGHFREVTMRLDTLFADFEEGKLYLTWRGLDSVLEDDLSDVATVLVASESLASEPLPALGYRAQLDAFEADPIGMAAAMPEGFMDLAERFAREEAGEAAADEPEHGSIARIPRLIKSFVEQLDGATSAQVEKMMGDAAKTAAGDTLRASLRQASGAAAGGSAPLLIPLKPGSMPPIRLGPQMRAMVAQVEQVKKGAAANGQTVVGLESIDAIVNNPQLKQIDPTYKPPGPDDPPPEEPGPGRNLSGQDLSGRDLRGVDLTGANLEDTIFTRANLRGVVFKGANMKYSVLYEADLTDATFDEADLTMAQIARTHAAGASFRGATLEQASFERADLTGATLEGAKGEYVRFSRANLSRAKANGAKLDRSHFDHAILEQTNLTGASLVACHFSGSRARGVVMVKATIARSTFEGADLTGALLAHAKGDKTVWMQAKLDGADLRYAWMTGAHFTEVSASTASFLEANLKEGRFYRASLKNASFVRANLFGADFCKASLVGVQFACANLYDAKFLGAARKDCDFSGANLKRSTLENRT